MSRILVHIIPAIGISFITQIILHEIGHLIGGFITGWKFLYLQVHKFVFKRVNRGLKIMVVGDIGYRCIMYPVSLTTNALIYTMGGCIINLFSAIVGFICMFTVSMSPVMWLYTWCFSVFGIGMYFMNGIASTKRVCNDKACYKLLKADKQTRICHNAQLLIAKDLLKGLTYNEIRKDIIAMCPDISKNDIQAYQAVLEYYYYLDNKNLLKMGQALNKIQVKNYISKEVLNVIETELIYIRLLKKIILQIDAKTFISSSEWKDIKEYVKKGDIHTFRVVTVYKAYVQLLKGNKDCALDVIEDAIDTMKKSNYVYEGESVFCVNQLVWIRESVKCSQKGKITVKNNEKTKAI